MGVVDRVADALPRGRGLLQLAADEPAHQAVLRAAGMGVPVHRLDLVAIEADQAVAAFEGVVEEGELVVAGERGEPEREPGEVHRHRVSVDAVKAALGHQPAGQQLLVLVGRDRRAPVWVARPGAGEPLGELAAGLDQEGARAHGRIAHLELEDLLRCGALAQALEGGAKGVAHDRLGERAGRVVRAGAAALLGRLQDRRAGAERRLLGRAADVDDGIERGGDVVGGLGLAEGVGDALAEIALALGFVLQVLGALRPGLQRRQRLEVGVDGRAVVLAGADGEGRGGGRSRR